MKLRNSICGPGTWDADIGGSERPPGVNSYLFGDCGFGGRRHLFGTRLTGAGVFEAGRIRRIVGATDTVVFALIVRDPRRIFDVIVIELGAERCTNLFVVARERRVILVRIGDDRLEDDGERASGCGLGHVIQLSFNRSRHCVSM